MQKNLAERGKKVVSPVLGRYFPEFEIEKSKGCHLFGTDGKKYLDFSSGIAACSTGYAHPKIVAAAAKQLRKLIHICIGIANYEPYIVLAEKLSKVVPIKSAQFFFCQSGSEAVEAAIKLAKYAQKKPGIVALRGAFHGRTLGALSVTTSKMKYRDGYEPLLPEVYIVEPVLDEIEKIFASKSIAAIIIELIFGEGGYITLHQEFVQKLRVLCGQYNVLLIVDEVQTGFGRSGKWFACEHYNLVPAILCLAKGMASGFPLGGIAAGAELMTKWPPGAHGSTFGGNPVCCAAGIATVEVIQKEKLVQNSVKLGAYLKKKLSALQTKYSQLIKEVRGKGLMLGVDFQDADKVKKIMNYCLAHGLVLISTGGDGTVIRFIPPLIVTKKQIDAGLKIFEAALNNAQLH
ncbi:MAG: aminotransferase class III-fold pyridoxal phosphate-dependent enzyme [Candidatus Margulisbacteria bacterium]|nr:aminotransferase class III-fold pyridoxal phosphate-dependent enzyme [Candidatus Margulisiibacteriota bacterium]